VTTVAPASLTVGRTDRWASAAAATNTTPSPVADALRAEQQMDDLAAVP
jgi:hypothetical protein